MLGFHAWMEAKLCMQTSFLLSGVFQAEKKILRVGTCYNIILVVIFITLMFIFLAPSNSHEHTIFYMRHYSAWTWESHHVKKTFHLDTLFIFLIMHMLLFIPAAVYFFYERFKAKKKIAHTWIEKRDNKKSAFFFSLYEIFLATFSAATEPNSHNNIRDNSVNNNNPCLHHNSFFPVEHRKQRHNNNAHVPKQDWRVLFLSWQCIQECNFSSLVASLHYYGCGVSRSSVNVWMRAFPSLYFFVEERDTSTLARLLVLWRKSESGAETRSFCIYTFFEEDDERAAPERMRKIWIKCGTNYFSTKIYNFFCSVSFHENGLLPYAK